MKIVSENASENSFFNPLNSKYSGLLIDMFLNNDAKFSNFRLKINTNNFKKICSCIKYTHLSSHQSNKYIFNASIKN